MGVVLNHNDKTKFIQSVPGPGAHDIATTFTKQRPPLYSMGVKLKQTLVKENGFPGPG